MKLHIFGYSSDVAIVKYLFSYLIYQLEKLADGYFLEYKTKLPHQTITKMKKEYLCGAVSAVLVKIDELVGRLGRENRADLCIAYVRGKPWIDSLVIGMETVEQLNRNISLFKNKPLTAAEQKLVEASLAEVPAELLNPALWRITHGKS